MPAKPSIVSTSIISAVSGEYGDFHSNYRTEGSELWINPLMGLYWTFNLGGVASRCLYLDKVKETRTYRELTTAIQLYRGSYEKRDWQTIPV